MKLKNLLFFCFLVPIAAMEQPKQEVFFMPSPASCNGSKDSLRAYEKRVDSLLEFAGQYLKRPYCYGSKPPKCFDCSGFVQFCFRHFGKELPHSSQSSAFLGKFVSMEHARKGDLIFFTGRSSQSETVGHMGIITEIKGSEILFIHASVQAGVIISSSEEAYYKQRFMMIKRIPF